MAPVLEVISLREEEETRRRGNPFKSLAQDFAEFGTYNEWKRV